MSETRTAKKTDEDLTERLKKIPGYEPGKPSHRMDDVTFMDELEAMWGRRWGAQSCIGELKTVLLSPPDGAGPSEEEKADPAFFVRFGRRPEDLPTADVRQKQHEERVALMKSEGVEVIEAYYPPERRKGVYTSVARGLGLEPVIIKGGAIIDRAGVAWKRGPQRANTEFLAKLGCPILYTVHGSGIHEVGGNILFLDAKHAIQATSVSTNMEGIRQVTPILEQAGIKEQHIAHMPSYLNNMYGSAPAMGFHLVNVLNMVAEKRAVCYPGAIPYETLRYLQSKGIRLIEAPEEEALNQACNTVALRPGEIIMAAGNPVTTAALRREGIRVTELEFATSRFGAGPRCIIRDMVRDDGPSLDD
jgi:N-dimethylarginine dimethylaminohydrolase